MAFFAHVMETAGGPRCKMENVSDREGTDDETTTSVAGSLTNSCSLTLRSFCQFLGITQVLMPNPHSSRCLHH